MDNDIIHLSATKWAHFFSVQGEGATCGNPAVFLRLAGCPLNCAFCDSKEFWEKGSPHSVDTIDKIFDTHGYYLEFRKGAHLVITGGDPMLQQQAIIQLWRRLEEFERNPDRIFLEVETQGTIVPTGDMLRIVRQWNISPKLANSGVPREKRLNYGTLAKYGTANTCFKFPVKTLDDLREVDEIVRACNIKRTRVYLMPICDSRGNFYVTAPRVAQMAMSSGFKFGNRLHLILWDNAPGH
jgi:7-carboxy-7-deazaguanine synthase